MIKMIIILFFNAMHFINFFYVESLLYFSNKYNLIVIYTPFNVLLNLVCLYFVGDICINIHQGYWL